MRVTMQFGRWKRALADAAGSLSELAWPHDCLACRAGLDDRAVPVCPACQDEISRLVAEPYCRTCGDDYGPHMLIDGRCGPCRRSLAGHPRFSGFVRVGPYAGALRRMVIAFKRAIVLEDILSHHLASALAGAMAAGLPGPDLLVPVPSHWWRRWQRGHQPTALLAERVGAAAGIAVAPALRVRRYVPPLHFGMSRADRAAALNGVFGVVDAQAVAGKVVGVVDDVMTTGATLQEARRVLRRAGAKRVCAIVVARASARGKAGFDEKADHAQQREQNTRAAHQGVAGVDPSIGAA